MGADSGQCTIDNYGIAFGDCMDSSAKRTQQLSTVSCQLSINLLLLTHADVLFMGFCLVLALFQLSCLFA